MHSSPFLTVYQNCDLHAARIASHSCECPHHGTDQCDCQMVVLLVYGSTSEPATLILHGNDGKTWLSVTGSEQTGNTLAEEIQQLLAMNESTSSGVLLGSANI